ncbi:hypothetical protein VF12_39465, partial [Nostoc linckia z15]
DYRCAFAGFKIRIFSVFFGTVHWLVNSLNNRKYMIFYVNIVVNRLFKGKLIYPCVMVSNDHERFAKPSLNFRSIFLIAFSILVNVGMGFLQII